MANFISPFGEIDLERNQVNSPDNLQAWDAADTLILDHIHDIENIEGRSILIVNDSFGSLACSLNHLKPTSWSDSYIAHKTTRVNIDKNGQAPKVTYLKSTELPSFKPDLVLIKLPKTLALLEHQLASLKPLLNNECTIVAGCMVKYSRKSYFQLFEKYVGTVTTSLAKKKARLLYINNDSSIPIVASPYPTNYYFEDYDFNLNNHANVFSREKIDLGSRFMLEYFDGLPKAEKIIDLACGNGVLGLAANKTMQKQHHITPETHYVDESYMAILSAQENAKEYGAEHDNFYTTDGLNETGITDADLILCNPPFHQGQVLSDETAWQMIVQSKTALKPGGELWLVGNRHQNYHVKMKKVFGNYSQISSNSKFVVIKAIKR